MSVDKRKKRNLSEQYHNLITFLVDNGKDIFELEFSDSERAAVRAKAKLREYRKKVDDFYEVVENVRKDIVDQRG